MDRDAAIKVVCKVCGGRMGGLCFGAGGGCQDSEAIVDGVLGAEDGE